MTLARARDDESGFTLLEMVIAMLVMSIAVVALVSGLSAMITLTQDNRAHAVTETASRSAAQAVIARSTVGTTLTGAVGAGVGTLPVADASLLPGPGGYIAVGRETMRVTSNGLGTSVGVAREQGGTEAAAHAADTDGAPTRVVPLLVKQSGPGIACIGVADLQPPSGTAPEKFRVTDGATPTVESVEYLTMAGAVISASACADAFLARCPSIGGVQTILPECQTTALRATVQVTTGSDARLNDITTKTQVVLRRGSV